MSKKTGVTKIATGLASAAPTWGSGTATLTAATDRRYQPFSLHITWVASATAGTRVPGVRLLDSSGNSYGVVLAGAGPAAGETRYHTFAPGLADQSSYIGGDSDYLTTPLPPSWLLAEDWDLEVFDDKAVDVADTVTVRILYDDVAADWSDISTTIAT